MGSSAVARYEELRDAARIRERPLFSAPRTPTELELQARWFAGDFGKQFRSTAGDDVEIVQFGTWNREAGPDFSDVAVRMNNAEPIRGSVEFDLTDRSWETHGHSTNAGFDDTVLHVFVHSEGREFFTRTSDHRNVTQVRVDPAALPDSAMSAVPLAKPGRCHAPLRDQPKERVTGMLDAAAHFRLRRKAARLHRLIENHGRDEALFQEIAAALGYKQNKLPFMLLAQRLPLALLRRDLSGIEARLFGVAGFLSAPDLSVYNRQTRGYVRALWDSWWPHSAGLQRLVLPAKLWKLSGARPLNHPQRRVAALATIAHEWPAFLDSLGPSSDENVSAFFRQLQHSFWDLHYTLTSDSAERAMALVGETRVAEILANVIYPYRLSVGEDAFDAYAKLRSRLTNRRVETAATRLFGDDARRAPFLKTVAHQQGLLQIYEDFCMQDSSDCSRCPFPEQMQKWK